MSGEQSLRITISINQSFCHKNFEIQQWYVITKFYVNNMTVYKRAIYEIKKHSQVKVILVFTIESVSSFFLINYIYTTHGIVVKLDDVRTRNRSFGCWTLCSSPYVRYATHTINMCCQKENRLVIVLFAANDGNHFHHWTFSYLLSISACAFDLTILFLWRKFHLEKVYQSMLDCYENC